VRILLLVSCLWPLSVDFSLCNRGMIRFPHSRRNVSANPPGFFAPDKLKKDELTLLGAVYRFVPHMTVFQANHRMPGIRVSAESSARSGFHQRSVSSVSLRIRFQ
jgi:hypothetical protein